jgi:membrane protein
MKTIWRRIRGAAHDVLAFTVHVARRFIADGCLMGAGALSYTTLVSLVPLIAIALAIFSAFPIFGDARDKLLELLFKYFVPDVGEEAMWWFKYFASSAAQTTALGVVALAVTAILMLATIEDQLHIIWRSTTPRPWVQRVLVYWTLLTLGPLLLAASFKLSGYFDAIANSLSIDAQAVERVTEAWFESLARWAPFLIETIIFTLIYCLVPNVMVRWREGFAGGLVAAALIELLKVGFAFYIARFSSYRTVYGALAAIPIFLLWMYISWGAVLFGAVVAAALPKWRVDEGVPQVTSGGRRLGLSLALLAELAARARDGTGTADTAALAARLGIAAAAVDENMGILCRAGFVVATADGCWVLARSLRSVTLFDLYRAIELPLAGDWQLDEAEAPWQAMIVGPMQRAVAAEAGAMRLPLETLLDAVDREAVAPLPRAGHGRG